MTGQQGRSGLGIEAQRETVRRFMAGEGGGPPLQSFTETESGRRDRERSTLRPPAATYRT
jgi:hypothetical protein